MSQTRVNLTEQYSIERQSYFQPDSPVDYNIFIQIEGETGYHCFVKIEFQLQKAPNILYLESDVQALNFLLINGQPHKDILCKFNQTYMLALPETKEGKNQIIIGFYTQYSNYKKGLKSAIQMGQQYIWSASQPNYLNSIFPCFDQPNLQGRFELSLLCPHQKWEIHSCEYQDVVKKVQSVEDFVPLLDPEIASSTFFRDFQFILSETETFHHFPRTEVIPTYVFSIIAGPYVTFQLEQTHRDIPMNIYTEQHLVDITLQNLDLIREAINFSMSVFQDFTGVPYPYQQFDIAFCPQFAIYGMENVGLVLITDKVFDDTEHRLVYIIAHELSHMWFGDYVTMDWWGDLWLNEGFATFWGHYCGSIIPYQQSDPEFRELRWGIYRNTVTMAKTKDATCSRGCITKVVDSIYAHDIFDAITYRQGSAAVYELLNLMGKENFQTPLRKYFAQFGFQNSTFNDFAAFYEETFDKLDLPFQFKEWADTWLLQPGVNNIETLIENEGSQIQEQKTENTIKFRVQQWGGRVLRWHQVRVFAWDQELNQNVFDVIIQPQEVSQVVAINPKNLKLKYFIVNFNQRAYVLSSNEDYLHKIYQDDLEKISAVSGIIKKYYNEY